MRVIHAIIVTKGDKLIYRYFAQCGEYWITNKHGYEKPYTDHIELMLVDVEFLVDIGYEIDII
jgi:hypothetical protein